MVFTQSIHYIWCFTLLNMDPTCRGEGEKKFSHQLNWRCFWFVVPWQGIWHLPYRELFERSVCGCTAGANVQPSMAHSSTGCHSPPPINDGELLNRFMKSLLKKNCFYIQPSQNWEGAVRDLFFCFSARVFDLAITVTPCTDTHADESFGILKILEWRNLSVRSYTTWNELGGSHLSQ